MKSNIFFIISVDFYDRKSTAAFVFCDGSLYKLSYQQVHPSVPLMNPTSSQTKVLPSLGIALRLTPRPSSVTHYTLVTEIVNYLRNVDLEGAFYVCTKRILCSVVYRICQLGLPCTYIVYRVCMYSTGYVDT